MKHKDPREKLRGAIEALALPAGARVLVAVSGGADSVALLRAFVDVACSRTTLDPQDPERNASQRYSLMIGHVNHELRGAESNEDEAFIVELGRELGVPTQVIHAPVNPGSGEEERSRDARYAALCAMLDGWKGDFVATAHTADDQAETVLMNLVRGSGGRGLGGIRPVSGCLIRPFLPVPREAITPALKAWKADFRVDSSNSDSRFLRNRMRADVLPLLKREHPESAPHISRMADIQATDVSYLEGEAEGLFPLIADQSGSALTGSSALIRSLHLSLQRHVVMLIVRETAHLECDYETVERILRIIEHGGTLSLGKDWVFRANARTFELFPPTWTIPEIQGATLEVPGEVVTSAGIVRAEKLPAWLESPEKLLGTTGPFVAFCDGHRTGGKLQVRSWQPGDRLQLLGVGGSKKLQDIFVDQKIPKEVRRQVPVVVSGGRIVWLAGLALSSAFIASAQSETVIRLTFATTIPELRDKMLG